VEQFIDLVITTLIILTIVFSSFTFFYYLSPKIRAEFLLKERMNDIYDLANTLNFLSHLYYNSSIYYELSDVQIICLNNGILFILSKNCEGKLDLNNKTVIYNGKIAYFSNNTFTEVYPNLYYGCVGRIAFIYKTNVSRSCNIDCKRCRLLFVKTINGIEIR